MASLDAMDRFLGELDKGQKRLNDAIRSANEAAQQALNNDFKLKQNGLKLNPDGTIGRLSPEEDFVFQREMAIERGIQEIRNRAKIDFQKQMNEMSGNVFDPKDLKNDRLQKALQNAQGGNASAEDKFLIEAEIFGKDFASRNFKEAKDKEKKSTESSEALGVLGLSPTTVDAQTDDQPKVVNVPGVKQPDPEGAVEAPDISESEFKAAVDSDKEVAPEKMSLPEIATAATVGAGAGSVSVGEIDHAVALMNEKLVQAEASGNTQLVKAIEDNLDQMQRARDIAAIKKSQTPKLLQKAESLGIPLEGNEKKITELVMEDAAMRASKRLTPIGVVTGYLSNILKPEELEALKSRPGGVQLLKEMAFNDPGFKVYRETSAREAAKKPGVSSFAKSIATDARRFNNAVEDLSLIKDSLVEKIDQQLSDYVFNDIKISSEVANILFGDKKIKSIDNDDMGEQAKTKIEAIRKKALRAIESIRSRAEGSDENSMYFNSNFAQYARLAGLKEVGNIPLSGGE